MDRNQDISPRELAKIRRLGDFDLIMLLSEIHDRGWPEATRTLAMMKVEDPGIPATTPIQRN